MTSVMEKLGIMINDEDIVGSIKKLIAVSFRGHKNAPKVRRLLEKLEQGT
jgi:hypothetical protein